MRKYSAVKIPFLSFFSKGLYRDVCFNRKGTGIGYLFLLMMFVTIPPVIAVQIGFSKFCRDVAPQIISQIPQITFSHGEAIVDAPQPCVIKDPATQKVVAIIDTTGKTTTIRGADAVILITRTEATLKKNDVETRSFNYTKLDNFVLTQAKLSHWLDIARKLFAPVMYPFLLLGLFIYRLTQLLIYSIIAMLIASWLTLRQPYASVLRLTSVAMTPSILVGIVFDMTGIHPPFAGLWFFLLTTGYLYFGIRECSRDFHIDDTQGAEAAVGDLPKDPEIGREEERF